MAGTELRDALVDGERMIWSGSGSWRACLPRFGLEAAASAVIFVMGATGYLGYLRPPMQGWNEQAALLYRLMGDVVSFCLTTWGAWGIMTATRDLVVHATGQYGVTDSRILIGSRTRPGWLTSLNVRDVAQVSTVRRGLEVRNSGGRVTHSLFGIPDPAAAHKAIVEAEVRRVPEA